MLVCMGWVGTVGRTVTVLPPLCILQCPDVPHPQHMQHTASLCVKVRAPWQAAMMKSVF